MRFAVQMGVAVLLLANGVGSGEQAAWAGKPRGAARGRPPARSIDQCVKYGKQALGDQGLRLELSNRCDFGVTCTLSWELRCLAGGPPTSHGARLELSSGASDAATASGSACGAAGWQITAIRWWCEELTPPSQTPRRGDDLSD
jgi:hypothetical protein